VPSGLDLRVHTRQTAIDDEFSITLAPVLFGTGIRLFDHVDPARLALDQARSDASSRVTHLTYTVVKR
jgi:dihydrofolate reductase